MRLSNSLTYLIVFLLFSHLAAADTIFLVEEGRVVFDVESVEPAEGWTLKTEIEGFRGTGYFEWTGPDYFKGADAGNGTIKYTFRISKAGNYQLRWRNRIAVGETSTEHNDSWIRLDTGVNLVDEQPISGWTKVYLNQPDNWNWETRTKDHVADPVRQYFNEGDHTLEISGRSAGHAIDRIVFYHYDTINFSDSTFNAFAISQTTDIPGTPGGGDPAPEPEPEPEPDPDAMDWSTTDPLESAGECQANTLALAPGADIYVQGSTVNDLLEIKIDGADRKGLMQFDLSLVPASKTGARLAFFTRGDSGDGAIGLYAGSHSNWAETDSTLTDVPSASVELGSYTGTFAVNTRFSLPFDSSLLSTDSETLLLQMSADSNDISILSSESDSGPRLLISGADTFCSEYEQLVAQNQTPPEPEPEPEPDPEPEPVDPIEESETPEVSDKSTTREDNVSSAGYVFTLVLIGILTGRRRRKLVAGPLVASP